MSGVCVRRDRRVFFVCALLAGLVPVLGCAREPAAGAEPAPGAEMAGKHAPPPAADTSGPSDFEARPADPQARGLVLRTAGAGEGYVLFSPLVSDTTYLIDRQGRPVHTWKSRYAPGSALYLLPSGHLLRNGRDPDLKNFRAGGTGGIFQQLDWDGQVVWEWALSTEERVQHHDIEPLPNGNVLALGWEVKSPEECAGRVGAPISFPRRASGPTSSWRFSRFPPTTRGSSGSGTRGTT